MLKDFYFWYMYDVANAFLTSQSAELSEKWSKQNM